MRAQRPASSRGVSLVEVLVAASVLAVAAIPVFSLVQAEHRQAHFDARTAGARARARRVLEALGTLGYEQLAELGRRGPGLPLPLPPVREEADALGAGRPNFAHLQAAAEAMGSWREAATFTELEPGLGQLTVQVSWRLPSSNPAEPERNATVRRLVSRGDVSLYQRHRLVRGGSADVPVS